MKPQMKIMNLGVLLLSLMFSTTYAEISDSDLAGLKLVEDGKHLKIYARSDTDLSQYSDFMLKSVTVTFDPDWLEDYNRERKSMNDRLNERDIAEITERFKSSFQKTLKSTLESEDAAKLTETASASTLTVESDIVDLRVNAPDKLTATRKTLFVRQAGKAELHTKMFDASGQLVVAIIDAEETREHFDLFETNRVRNQYEFTSVYRTWAKNWLKALP